jgi:hypothetical protein
VADALPQPIGRGRDTLAQLAANTGGRFVGDSNDLQGGLVGLLEASRCYYVLAFEPLDPKGKPDRRPQAGDEPGAGSAPGRRGDRQGALRRTDPAPRRRGALPERQGRPVAARDPPDRREGGEGRVLDSVTLAPRVDLGAVRSVLEAKGFQVITSFAGPDRVTAR